jgi:apolipoprotein N-acyltransferase
LHALSFAPSYAWFLQPLALAALVGLLAAASVRQAACLGAAFGLAWMAVGLWWLYISLHDYGGLPAPFAVAALLLLGAFLSLYTAGAAAAFVALRPKLPAWASPALWAGCWLLAELARAQWFTGFPWIASGYAHTVGLWAPWAPWVGVYAIGAFAALWAASLALAVQARLWLPLVLATGLGLVGWVLPSDFTRSAGNLPLSLLQPNVPQSAKFDPAQIDRNLDALLSQIEATPPGLVVTPESVLPLPLDYLPLEARERLARASMDRQLLMGTFLGSDSQGWVNSLVGWHQGQAQYDYGKRHLLPFGEFIPPGFGWFVRALNIPMDDQSRGAHQKPWSVAGQALRPLICYEDLFGEDIVASAMDGPEAATVFVNASNLAWFGRWMVQDQHLQFSQMRAMEFQRPVVRSTNTGATAHVDHQGKVRARLAPLTQATLTVSVEGRRGSTPYARWLATTGLWPLWLLGGLPLVVAAFLARRRA